MKSRWLMLVGFALLMSGCVEMDVLRQENEEKEAEIRQLREQLAETRQPQQQQSVQRQLTELAQTQQRGGGFPGDTTAMGYPAAPVQTPVMQMPAPIPNTSLGAGIPPAPQFSANGESAATPVPVEPVSSVTALRTDLETVLGDAIKQGQVAIQQNGSQVVVVIRSDLVFEQGAQVSPAIVPYLQAVGNLASRDPNLRASVQAYASGVNVPLATQQSQSVAESIKANSSIGQMPTYAGSEIPAGQPARERVEIRIQ